MNPLKNTQHSYYQPVELPFSLPTRVYAAMLVIWLLRPDLQRRFPLYKEQQHDYLRFLSWCTAIGRREHQILRDIPAWNEELLAPIRMPQIQKEPWHATFNVAMYLTGLHRSKLWNGQISFNALQRHRTARAYFREGRHMLGLVEIPRWQLGAIEQQFNDFEAFLSDIALPKDNQEQKDLIRQYNQDLALAWGEGAEHALKPIETEKSTQLSASLARTLPIPANKVLALVNKRRRYRPTVAQLTQVAEKIPLKSQHTQQNPTSKEPDYPFGVNLFGYARGELGIGEDVRTVAAALKSAGVPFCIINIELGSHISQHDRSAEHWISNVPLYNINLFCMTGIEMARYGCERGLGALENRYNIGLWPWELPRWPKAWHHAWNLVDELWGISQYAADAYQQAPVPVLPMPLPVQLGELSELNRVHWQLPEKAYLFVFAFDMNSTLTRKNPEGVIDAFLQAFPNQADDQVGLVLKISHLDRTKPKWRDIAKHIRHDPRIYLVDEELRKPDVLALYKACDCVVSLHRSEGFGRMLAEAQLLGKPLIATAYSGNMDYCAESPTLTVGYTEQALQESDYFYGTGQHWAEPKLEEAAQAMRECATNPEYRKPQSYNTHRFSPETCGLVFRNRLTQIAQTDTALQRKTHD